MALTSIEEKWENGITIFWRIENFNLKTRAKLLSSVCKINELRSNWRIEVAQKNGCLYAFLEKLTNSISLPLTCRVSLLTGKGWWTFHSVEEKEFNAKDGGWGKMLIRMEDLEEGGWVFLPNGSLTVKFFVQKEKYFFNTAQYLMISRMLNECEIFHREIEVFSTLTPEDMFSFPLSYEFSFKKMITFGTQTDKKVKTQIVQTDTNVDFKDAKMLLNLFHEKQFSFVTLRTSTKEFYVHKAVLCAKSPVFNAMFQNKMKEENSMLVDIEDVESDTLALLLKFLHFEPLGDLNWDETAKLFYAADKYEMNPLKNACVTLLTSGLSVDNVCEAMVLADMHQNKDLMSSAQDYFCKHSKAILSSKQWRDFLCHTDLVAEVSCRLAEKM